MVTKLDGLTWLFSEISPASMPQIVSNLFAPIKHEIGLKVWQAVYFIPPCSDT